MVDRNDYISLSNLAKSVGRNAQTLNVYLSRSEFSHIQRFYKGHYVYFRNFKKGDIERLKEFINTTPARQCKRG